MCRHSAPVMIPRSRHHDENEEQPAKTAGPAGIVRRAFGQGTRPEEELERLLVERAAELEEYGARFEETALELNRREERLRDERASVERLLRQSTAELEAREEVVTPEAIVEIDRDEYHVARVGRSPLPGDSRRCAYLVRLAPDIAE